MKSKIRLTYIPDNNKVEKAIIRGIDEALSVYDGPTPINIVMLTNMNTVDINISPGSLFKSVIKENMEYVSQENIMNSILSNIKMNKSLIILNGYNIDLQSLRDNIYPMLDKQSVMFLINNISKDKDLEIPFTYSCTLTDKMQEEDWEEIFEGFDKSYEEDKNKPKKTENLFDFLAGAILSGLTGLDDESDDEDDDIEVKTFNLDESSIDDLFPKDFVEGKRTSKKEKFNNEIIESASFGNKEHCLDIDLYDNGSIRLGSDEGDVITIHSSMLKFLINYLNTTDIDM